jgi:HEAT repeat protein
MAFDGDGWQQYTDARRRRDPVALAGLLDRQKDASLVIRSLQALGDIRGPKALETITRYLDQDDRPAVQNGGMDALRRLGDSRAIPILRDALTRAGEPCRFGAVQALGDIGGDDAVQALRSDVAFSSKPREYRLIGRRVSDEDELLRAEIADALGKIGTDSAVDALESMLVTSAHTNTRAYRALVEIGSPAAADALERALPRARNRRSRWRVQRQIRRIRARADR